MHPYHERLAREAAAAELEEETCPARNDAPLTITAANINQAISDLQAIANLTDNGHINAIIDHAIEMLSGVSPLTVADVLKRSSLLTIKSADCDYEMNWHHDKWHVYIWSKREAIFESSDESAACAEFLRLTGGGE